LLLQYAHLPTLLVLRGEAGGRAVLGSGRFLNSTSTLRYSPGVASHCACSFILIITMVA